MVRADFDQSAVDDVAHAWDRHRRFRNVRRQYHLHARTLVLELPRQRRWLSINSMVRMFGGVCSVC